MFLSQNWEREEFVKDCLSFHIVGHKILDTVRMGLSDDRPLSNFWGGGGVYIENSCRNPILIEHFFARFPFQVFQSLIVL